MPAVFRKAQIVKKIWIAVAALLLCACASLNPVAKPEVAITSINLGVANGLQQQLLIGLQLDNPNSFALQLGRLRYEMSLAGSKLASGSFNEAITVPANGQSLIEVPVGINLLSGFSLLRNLLSNVGADLEYELKLSADVGNFGLGDMTLVKQGVVGINGQTTPE